MTQEILSNILLVLKDTSQRTNTNLAFMGGIAVSIWARPRTTYDVDCVIGVTDKKFCDMLTKKGFEFERGSACEEKKIKSIRGIKFITMFYKNVYIDLFLAESEWEKKVLERAKQINFQDTTIPVISPEDLILYKLLAGRNRDTEDVREILKIKKETLDFEYLKIEAEKLSVLVFLEDELESIGI